MFLDSELWDLHHLLIVSVATPVSLETWSAASSSFDPSIINASIAAVALTFFKFSENRTVGLFEAAVKSRRVALRPFFLSWSCKNNSNQTFDFCSCSWIKSIASNKAS